VRVQIGTAGRTRSTITDGGGRFAFDLPPGAYALHADLVARQLGAVMPVDVGLEPEPAEADGGVLPRALAELTVSLVPTARLVGVVRDERGRPLPGAFARIEEEERPLSVEVETGSDGRFAVDGRLPGLRYRLTVRRAGYIPDGPRLVKVGAGADVQLRRGAILSGTVVDERGTPVIGAELAVVTEDGAQLSVNPELGSADVAPDATTDGWRRLEPAGELGVLHPPIPYPPAHPPAMLATAPTAFAGPRSGTGGQFRIAELAAGPAIITARHPDFAAGASVSVRLGAGETRTVQLVLRKGATVRGRVLDERGGGIADAEVMSSDGRTSISDAGGRFAFEHLIASVRISARHAGYLKGEGEARVGDGDREVNLDLTLARALGRLGGQVVDARGGGVAGARVTVTPRGGEAARASTDAGGRFLLEGLADGPYRVEVERAGLPSLRLSAIEASAEARLVLEDGGGVEGEIFDPRTGLPPPDLRLELVLDGERRAVLVQGRHFSATGLPTGPARLVARARGYPRVERAVEILAGERPGEITVRDVRIELELGGAVRGRVRDDRGEPAVGVAVEVMSAPVEPVRTGADGVFVLAGVPPGRVEVRARGGDPAVTTVEEVEVRANEETRIDLTLPPAR
jgi:hypothetical protein